ncbi:MAG: hypothetical protein LBM26_05120 [Methanobrevibacter sp.]|jgi:hypothetical protein|nr:hypothetical protein [Methanobrevibacter sp.]
MKCQNHFEREAVSQCQLCGKTLCEECEVAIAGKTYCENCIAELIGSDLAKIATNKVADAKTSDINEGPDDIYSDDRLYEDTHSTDTFDPAIEEKYEKYLDDLYFDEEKPVEDGTSEENIDNLQKEKELSLSEQLSIDEAENGPLTKEPYVPKEEDINEKKQKVVPILNNLRKDNPNNSNVNSYENKEKYVPHSLHRKIHYKETNEKNPLSRIEILLIAILVILILFVIAYVTFLLTLRGDYINFFDALGALFTNPGELINNIFN